MQEVPIEYEKGDDASQQELPGQAQVSDDSEPNKFKDKIMDAIISDKEWRVVVWSRMDPLPHKEIQDAVYAVRDPVFHTHYTTTVNDPEGDNYAVVVSMLPLPAEKIQDIYKEWKKVNDN